MINQIPIPIIGEETNGYYEIYQDHQGEVIKKIWHNEKGFKKVGDIIKNKIENNMVSLESLYNEEKENQKSNFISLDDGDSFEGQFVGVEKTTGQFGEVNSFTFVVNGEQKILNSKSFGLLKNMVKAGVRELDKVKITKTGAGFKTKFAVSKIE